MLSILYLALSLVTINHIPDNNISVLLQLKIFADNKFNVSIHIKFVFHCVENFVDTSIFSFSHNALKRFFPHKHQKSPLRGKRITGYNTPDNITAFRKVSPIWATFNYHINQKKNQYNLI